MSSSAWGFVNHRKSCTRSNNVSYSARDDKDLMSGVRRHVVTSVVAVVVEPTFEDWGDAFAHTLRLSIRIGDAYIWIHGHKSQNNNCKRAPSSFCHLILQTHASFTIQRHIHAIPPKLHSHTQATCHVYNRRRIITKITAPAPEPHFHSHGHVREIHEALLLLQATRSTFEEY
jgi:hypothetical protein